MNKATINLKNGKQINLDLFPEQAPISVANFIQLANANFYTGTIFHRVIRGFMIQGGGFTSGLKEKSAPKTIKGEFASNKINNTTSHTLGTLSMARTNVKDSASSQFFICVDNTPHLDGEYAAFGRVSDKESLAVIAEISKVATSTVGYYGDVPREEIVIDSITIG